MASSPIKSGCLGFLVLGLALIFAAVGLVWVQAQSTPKGPSGYVALGSSFAAGAGLGPLQKGSPLLCARSINGYPQQLARLRALAIVDMSCGGAVTKNVLHGGQFFQGPQLRVVGPDTRLITLTAGGNDVGYIGDLGLLALRKTHGVAGWLARTLWKGPKPLEQRDWTGLHDQLLATLQTLHARAPRAVVVVATYPAILPPNGVCDRLRLTPDEANLMRAVAGKLAEVTQTAAKEGGAILVDMNALGQDHNACAPDPWTRGSTNGGVAPFHPTLAGADATAHAISSVLPNGL